MCVSPGTRVTSPAWCRLPRPERSGTLLGVCGSPALFLCSSFPATAWASPSSEGGFPSSPLSLPSLWCARFHPSARARHCGCLQWRSRSCVLAGPRRCAARGACGMRGVGRAIERVRTRSRTPLCVCARLPLPVFLGGPGRDAELPPTHLQPFPTPAQGLLLRSAGDVIKA